MAQPPHERWNALGWMSMHGRRGRQSATLTAQHHACRAVMQPPSGARISMPRTSAKPLPT